jgi:hypothetical protein
MTKAPADIGILAMQVLCATVPLTVNRLPKLSHVDNATMEVGC